VPLLATYVQGGFITHITRHLYCRWPIVDIINGIYNVIDVNTGDCVEVKELNSDTAWRSIKSP